VELGATTGASVAVCSTAADDESRTRRKTVGAFLLIFALALGVRIAFFTVQVIHSPAAWNSSVLFEEDEMDQIALNVAQGRGFSSPFGPGATPTAWVCPLVPYLWAFVIWCVGRPSGLAHLIICYTATVPSAACVAVYWLIARHLLRGSPTLRRTALLVAAIFCIWPESLYVLDVPWYMPWQELATAVMVLLGMKWIDRPTLKTVVPVGIAAGVLSLINVTPLPIFAVILLLPVLENGAQWKRILGCGTAGAALAMLVALPWVIRNAEVLHAFVPMRANGGFQFWEGNNPAGCVREDANSVHPGKVPAELKRYQAMGEVPYSRQRFRDALVYIRAHPDKTIVRTAERAYVTWLTDVFDQWRWDSGTLRWWHQPRPAILKTLSSLMAAWVLVTLLIWALLSKRLAALPYRWLFAGIVFFLPFPYYFTLADNRYSQILRSWLLLLAILAFSAGFRKVQRRQQAT
jgi:hypothetical protein